MKEDTINEVGLVDDKAEETIEKVSDTEIKITTVTPEKVIPMEVKEEVISLSCLQDKKKNLIQEIEMLEQRKSQLEQEIVQNNVRLESEISTIVNRIVEMNSEIEKIDAIITEAKSKGVLEIKP